MFGLVVRVRVRVRIKAIRYHRGVWERTFEGEAIVVYQQCS